MDMTSTSLITVGLAMNVRFFDLFQSSSKERTSTPNTFGEFADLKSHPKTVYGAFKNKFRGYVQSS